MFLVVVGCGWEEGCWWSRVRFVSLSCDYSRYRMLSSGSLCGSRVMWLGCGKLVYINSICCDRLLGWSVVAHPSVVVNHITSIEYRENQTISVTSSNFVWTIMYRSFIAYT